MSRFLGGAARKGVLDMSFRILEVNGGPAALTLSGDKPESLFRIDVADGRIQTVYILRDPDKPTRPADA